jgi:hypothetical protein
MMRKPKEKPPRFRVGDWVSFLHLPSLPRMQIVEDRGCLGVNGMRLYRVRADVGLEEADTFDAREEYLVAAEPEKAVKGPDQVEARARGRGKGRT